MRSVIDNQTNPWGTLKGVEIQRSDLWIVDFKDALQGLNQMLTRSEDMTPGLAPYYLPPKLASYFVQNVTLPELKTRAEPIRRDSRPYPTPSWDEALEPISMTFILDCYTAGSAGTANTTPYKSDVYQMLDGWRAVVRAGRGAMSSEYAIRLNADYRIDYAFDVRLLLLRGVDPQVLDTGPAQALIQQGNALAGLFGYSTIQTVGLAASAAIGANSIINDLQFSSQFRLTRCWLGSFKLSEMSYDTAKVVTLAATFYADDIQQIPQKAT